MLLELRATGYWLVHNDNDSHNNKISRSETVYASAVGSYRVNAASPMVKSGKRKTGEQTDLCLFVMRIDGRLD